MSDFTYHNEWLTRAEIGEPFGISDEEKGGYEGRLNDARRAVLDAHEHGELGFLDLPSRDPGEIESWAARTREGRWTDAVVIGIGGSSLGARAILETTPAAGPFDGLDVHVTENVDPVSFGGLLDELSLETTLFVVVTKSGTTVETMSKFSIVFDRLCETYGAERAAEHIVAVTSPDSGALRQLADGHGFESFSIPPNVGGRFSVLTPVGLVPLALAGYPIRELLDGAEALREVAIEAPLADNPVLQLTADIHILYERGLSNLVMMAYSDQMDGLVDWFRQLWAESLGKARDRGGAEIYAGMTPIKAIGTIDQHSQVQLYVEGPADRLVLFVAPEEVSREITIPETGLPDALSHLAGHSLGDVLAAELEGTQRALGEAGRPTARLILPDLSPASVGEFLLAWELITALMGELLDIDAYNQPGVERGKVIAHELLGRSVES